MMDSSTFPNFATNAIHVGHECEQWKGNTVVVPISLGTTFKQTQPGVHSGYDYSRSGNPTRDVLEKCLASLEDAKHGLAFASGLAATTTLTHLLPTGSHVICMDDVYGGTNRYMNNVASRNGLEVTFVDGTDYANVTAAIKPNTKMVWIESPTNPLLKLADIRAIADAVHGADPNIILVMDNTFMSPYFQRPLNFGADIVLHSATKYINGHTDVVMGVIMTNNDELCKQIKYLQNSMGAVPSPFDCFLVNRGVKTLAVRMKEHFKNGLFIAECLEKDPRIETVIFPALPSHPQHELYLRQCRGCSGMITMRIKGDLESSKKFFEALKIFVLAESLGGYESLAEHPALMTHASVPKDHRDMLGISDNLIRLSVGLEDKEDLLEDLLQALTASVGPIV